MKKKVISMLMCFALLFALTACKEGKTGDENGGVPCPIEGLEWGMTVDECLAALSLTEDDVEIDRREGENGTNVIITASLTGHKAYGYPVEGLGLLFYGDLNGLPVGLCNITIRFNPAPALEELQTAVKEEVQSYLIEYPGSPLNDADSQTYITAKTIEDVDSSLRDKYLTLSIIESRKKEDFPYGRIWVGKRGGDPFITVDNMIATVVEKASEAEKK